MGKITSIISNLKDLRAQAVKLQNEANIRRSNNDIGQFYEDSLKVSNMNDGMVMIILKDSVIKEKALSGLSHRKVAQEIFDNLPVKHINLAQVPGDFGYDIAREYDCVFIRLVSILNGSSIIYCPNECNEFQIAELEKFNNELKAFNAGKKNNYQAEITFMYDETEGNNLDQLIEILKDKSKSK